LTKLVQLARLELLMKEMELVKKVSYPESFHTLAGRAK